MYTRQLLMLLLLIMMMVIMELTPHSIITALEELAAQRPTPPRSERLASNAPRTLATLVKHLVPTTG